MKPSLYCKALFLATALSCQSTDENTGTSADAAKADFKQNVNKIVVYDPGENESYVFDDYVVLEQVNAMDLSNKVGRDGIYHDTIRIETPLSPR